jgi:hypothetical protein
MMSAMPTDGTSHVSFWPYAARRYGFGCLARHSFGAIYVYTHGSPATKRATLTFRVCCESEHGIAGIPLLPMSP